jgi:hypothetical protein
MEDGDILDEFDDDALAKSIEKGQSGPWKDNSAAFEDPKLAQLQKQLMEPTKLTYEQRRMRELQARTAKAEQDAARSTTKLPDFEAAPEVKWSETPTAKPAAPVWNELGTIEETPRSAKQFDFSRKRPTPRPLPVASTTRAAAKSPSAALPRLSVQASLQTAAVVFAVATIAHGTIAGFHLDLILRYVFGALSAGFLWHRHQNEPQAAIAIGVGAYLMAFLPSLELTSPYKLIGLSIGFFTVAVGSTLQRAPTR